MTKPRLAISFSGGRSSAVMLKLCLEKYSDTHDILITFVNTGCEHEETLRFVDAVDRHFANGRVIWIEAVINGPGTGPTAKIVDYETAARNGEPFEAAIKKHGVFGPSHPQCTSRLKEEPMAWFRRQHGWGTGTYDTAIGIRADEIDRCSSRAEEKRFVYPLVEFGWTKRDVNRFMAQFEWDLKLPSDAFGNCVWCWKKSLRKLMTVAKAAPEAFDFPDRMERQYGQIHNGKDPQEKRRVFFRNHMTAAQIIEKAQTERFKSYHDELYTDRFLFDESMDIGSGSCGESCEVGADD